MQYKAVKMTPRGIRVKYFAADTYEDILALIADDGDEWEDAEITPLSETNERVIFDNAGGITVQLLKWASFYDDPKQAAKDVADWIKYRDTSDWFGHEAAALDLDPSPDGIRNGGYVIWNIGEDYTDIIDWGANTDEFFTALEQNLALEEQE